MKAVMLGAALSAVVVVGETSLADSWDRVARWTLDEVNDNASGVAYSPSTESLWIVRNSAEAIFEYDLSGRYRGRVDLSGFSDTEGIAYMGPGRNGKERFAVVEEGKGRIAIIDVRSGGRDRLSYSAAEVLDLDLGDLGNKGLEGIAYNAARNVFYVVTEGSGSKGKHIFEVDRRGRHRKLFDAKDKLDDLKDLSGLYFHQPTQRLWIASDESRRILEVSLSGKVHSKVSLSDVRQAEGVTFVDDRYLIVVSEPDKLYAYKR